MITLLAIGFAMWLIWRLMFLAEDVIINKLPFSTDSTGFKYLALAVGAFGLFFILFRSKIRFK
jgi:hypothetical protein